MNKKTKILLNWFLGPLFFMLLSWSLYRQIVHQPDLAARWQQIRSGYCNAGFIIVVLLMVVNWGIEARKWQLLVAPLQRLSLFNALKSVLAGTSVTMLTPNRVGEYGGRILYIEEAKRLKAISLAIVGSMSQLLVTLLMGCAGLVVLKFFHFGAGGVFGSLPSFWLNTLLYLSGGTTLVFAMFYLRIGWLVRMMEKINRLEKAVNYIRVLDEFSGKQLAGILFLSFLRYLVFVLQYVLLLHMLHVEVTFYWCFWLVSVFYFVIAIAPTIGFIELPLRVRASWEIFRFYTSNELGVGAAGLGIWLINLVVPAIIGSLFILSVKIVREK